MPGFKKGKSGSGGQTDSIEDICNAAWEPVYRFIYYKVQNREEAEDITQETFAKAIPYLQKGRVHPEKYIGFLKTVSLNILRDLWRKKQRRGTTIDIDLSNPMESAASDHAENSTERIIIENALKQLTKEQRTVIELRILKGYSVADTARVMNKKEIAVRVMQHRALQALAAILKKGGTTS
ncbi:RNA polymerase sigma factor [Neobacillus mesonae]|uniref:RNA polymerase sigma factor n=1 Tax=Neobacillus mesonae TaxID=1193713 RepID=UPI00203FB528|nr:sigma-70 family RNA polymerase sigma factor [Neobacillus mesonae]MCM3570522.1 sigma-70 family RNA polymerase sigma factor [Neobacillus mesonae]